tara:strand:+ start:122 stop:724 length:603 start_codon:yes stop_codon:yes gene_type:complete
MYKIESILPVPFYTNYVPFKFNKKQKDFIKKAKRKNNSYNKSTLNTYVLNLPLFKNFKKHLEKELANYVQKVLIAEDRTKFFITQSWFNFTQPGEKHHAHEHPNSFISGVYYVNAFEHLDSIVLNTHKVTRIKLPAKNVNEFTGAKYPHKVKTGDFVMFPSYLNHQVKAKEGSGERISLAFNVFVKGKIGDEIGLWELRL